MQSITKIKIKDLKRAEYNPRFMPDREMESLILSIKEHGFIESMVVNGCQERYGTIVGGHQRLTALERLIAAGHIPKNIEQEGEDYLVPCILVEMPDTVKEKELNIALNRIKGKFDEEKLYSIILDIKDSPTLPTTGFGEDEISKILDLHMAEDKEDEGEELPVDPDSQVGTIYELGPHRLIVGDSTDPATYQALLQGEKAAMVWTDPPYNVNYKSDSKNLIEGGVQSIKNDHMDSDSFKKLAELSFASMMANLKEGGGVYACCGWGPYPDFLQALKQSGFRLSAVIIWVKNGGVLGFQDYKPRTEWIAKAKKPDKKTAEGIIYGWKNGVHEFQGSNEFDVWEMPRKAVIKYLHPTEKPDWLPMRAIRNSSKRNDIILDPFAGSGSVMAAAEKTGRRAFMIELDPRFADVIRKRWSKIAQAKNENGQSNTEKVATN